MTVERNDDDHKCQQLPFIAVQEPQIMRKRAAALIGFRLYPHELG